VILVLVASAAGVGDLLGRRSPAPSSSGTTEPIPSPSGRTGTSLTGKGGLDVSRIAAMVDPATVDITSVITLPGQAGQAEGTGMILTSNGDVLTNNHVVQGATSITAQIEGRGTKYTVKVLGTDATHDVALVQLVGASNLATVKIGNSSAVRAGDPVVAIGNALGLGGTPTVTSGIISALGRSITASDSGTNISEQLKGLLQTDAPINPGNSGGPLVDASGAVIGMNTAASQGSATQGASNIGFAIPINRAIAIAQQIQQGKGGGSIQIGTHGIMGVEVETIATARSQSQLGLGVAVRVPVTSGAFVAQVQSGSPAASAGIAAGDVIIAANGRSVSSPISLHDALQNDHPGTSVSVTWVDGTGTRHTGTLTLATGPVT
jgi:S1-C subfamily serine protease